MFIVDGRQDVIYYTMTIQSYHTIPILRSNYRKTFNQRPPLLLFLYLIPHKAIGATSSVIIFDPSAVKNAQMIAGSLHDLCKALIVAEYLRWTLL